jgi:hypothetical protein
MKYVLVVQELVETHDLLIGFRHVIFAMVEEKNLVKYLGGVAKVAMEQEDSNKNNRLLKYKFFINPTRAN